VARERRTGDGGVRKEGDDDELRGIGTVRKSERMRDWGKGVEEARVRARLGEGHRCGVSGGRRGAR
jgi:hypothetical protein